MVVAAGRVNCRKTLAVSRSVRGPVMGRIGREVENQMGRSGLLAGEEVPLAEPNPAPGWHRNRWDIAPIPAVDTARNRLLRACADSDAFRPLIPTEVVHPFRRISSTRMWCRGGGLERVGRGAG